MSSAFRAVQWNRTKLVYDGILLVGVTLYIGDEQIKNARNARRIGVIG